MIENLINRITDRFYDNLDDEDEIEVFKYGLEAIISSILCLGIALLLCFLLKELRVGAIFMLLLTPIKLMFTSYHCNHRYSCIMTYSSIVLMNVYLYHYIDFSMLVTVIALLAICLIRKKEMTPSAFLVVIIYFLCMFLFNEDWNKILSLAIFTELLLIIMGDIKKVYNNLKKPVSN